MEFRADHVYPPGSVRDFPIDPEFFRRFERDLDPGGIPDREVPGVYAAAYPRTDGLLQPAQEVVEIQLETSLGEHADLDCGEQAQRVMAADGTIVTEPGEMGIR